MNQHFLSEWPAPSEPLDSLRLKLLAAGFTTAHEVLSFSNTFLRSRLPKNRGISDPQIDNARRDLAAWISSEMPSETVWEAVEHQQLNSDDDACGCLSTGDPELDALLHGGLRPGVTEITGEA